MGRPRSKERRKKRLQKKLAPAFDAQNQKVKTAVAACMIAREQEVREALVTELYIAADADEETVRAFYRDRVQFVTSQGMTYVIVDYGKPEQKAIGSFPSQPSIKQNGAKIDVEW